MSSHDLFPRAAAQSPAQPDPARPAPRGPGRPARLGGDAIAEAVLAVGFTKLTFACLAEHLGVAQATLYRHAKNRDELVRIGLDLALRRIEWPNLEGPWKPMLERWALASWRAWEAYPGAALEATRGVVPESMVALSGRLGRALVNQGFSPRNAVLAVDLVFDLTADSRKGAEILDAEPEPTSAPVRAVIEREWGSHHAEDEVSAQLRGEMVRAIREEPVIWFHQKLRVVLSGIELELAPDMGDDSDGRPAQGQ